jgi:hypothetical protein
MVGAMAMVQAQILRSAPGFLGAHSECSGGLTSMYRVVAPLVPTVAVAYLIGETCILLALVVTIRLGAVGQASP